MTKLRRAEKVGRRFLNPVPTKVGGLGTVFKVLPQFIFNQEERVPRSLPGPFRTDAAVYATDPVSGLRVTWMGHTSMLVEIDGVRVLVDPVWDERASPVEWAGPKRFFDAPLPLEALPRIDAVLVSHDHYDHLGAGTVRRLSRLASTASARWVTSLGVGGILRRLGVRPDRITELDWTDTVSIEGVNSAACHITSLPSRHFSGRGAFNRFQTLWASFVLRGAGHSVYFGADSGWWDGIREIGAKHGPFDLTMLEIGAYNDLWHQIHMGPDGAARAFRALNSPERETAGGMGLLMPIHWGLFDLGLHGWRQPIERMLEVASAEGLKLWSPEPGLPTEVEREVEVRSDWWQR